MTVGHFKASARGVSSHGRKSRKLCLIVSNLDRYLVRVSLQMAEGPGRVRATCAATWTCLPPRPTEISPTASPVLAGGQCADVKLNRHAEPRPADRGRGVRHTTGTEAPHGATMRPTTYPLGTTGVAL